MCDVGPFTRVAETMRSRQADGSSGALGFTYRDPDVATEVRRSLPWAQRLLVVAHSYLPEAGSPGAQVTGTGTVARFATVDHYQALGTILDELAAMLRGAGHRAEVLVDDNRLVDRAAAVRAGVGWWGKSTLVLVPGAGPWVLLGSVAMMRV